MSIGMFFYLVDLLTHFKLLLAVIAGVLGTVVTIFLIIETLNCEADEIGDTIKRYSKLLITEIILAIILCLIPSTTTLYIMGGEKAVYAIAENKDNKEVIDLVKQITVKKLKEISTSLDKAKGGD